MGNQNSQNMRRISTESAPGGSANNPNGATCSADPSPKRSHHPTNKLELGPDSMLISNKLELPKRPRRHSDASNGEASRSPSPTLRNRARTGNSNQNSPRVTARHSQPMGSESPALSGKIPRTPRLAFKKFQVDFNLSFMSLGSRRSRRSSAEQEPLSIKIPEGEIDNTPKIPRSEIYEPVISDLESCDLATLSPAASTFRVRASTISNGHVSRLKTLLETQESTGGQTDDKEVAKKAARPTKRKKIPTVFRYMIPNNRKGPTPNDPPVPIKQIFIAGTMSGWKSIEMTRTKGDAYFCVIIDCYEGDVFYKFCVDGEWTIDFSMEKVIGQQNVLANVICVKKSDSEVLEALACDSFIVKSAKPDGPQAQSDWGQVKPKWETKKRSSAQNNGTTNGGTSGGRGSTSANQGPPFLPPQLLKSLLNKEAEQSSDPNLLPEPASHVMLNHLYAQSVKDNVLVMASTTRFRRKYATVVLYKPID